MINRDKVKGIMKALGADLCGIASIDRFEGAPEGYHPLDVFPACKSVISFGCRFPIGTLFCESHTPYTQVRNTITPKMDMIALNFCMEMERHEIMHSVTMRKRKHGELPATNAEIFAHIIWEVKIVL